MMIHHFFYIFVGMIAILATKQIPLKKHWQAWRVESQLHKKLSYWLSMKFTFKNMGKIGLGD